MAVHVSFFDLLSNPRMIYDPHEPTDPPAPEAMDPETDEDLVWVPTALTGLSPEAGLPRRRGPIAGDFAADAEASQGSEALTCGTLRQRIAFKAMQSLPRKLRLEASMVKTQSRINRSQCTVRKVFQPSRAIGGGLERGRGELLPAGHAM